MTDARPQLLLVDDDPAAIAVMAKALVGAGALRFATDGEAALALARSHVPDLVLLDAEMPGIGGGETCRRFKADPLLARVPIIFVTSHAEPAFEIAGLDMGAADFIAKPVHPQLLLARVRTQLRMKQMADQLLELSVTDGLTGLANRRRFDELLSLEWDRARRSCTPMALVLVDVDHFKRYNDRHGHPAGDVCLQRVGQALASVVLRPADLAARYGGEEFVVLLPGTEPGGAQAVARRLVQAVEALAIAHADSPVSSTVTVSAGLATCTDVAGSVSAPGRPGGLSKCTDASALLQAADAALYAAKVAGRARACWIDAAVPAAATTLAPWDGPVA
ncbi:diguanylate cyclase domain-containing protein [Aquabacterium sp. J223]|uniref:diguanylate cyclase domain-containing protein n=1 Tax=Aquabacterium sp. J223 TaxID=2898431 RepID=UPI0021AD9E89|nr:diguanylate cyclase [Aquabacterium sp. J223]UUX94558.1 diguanylate cyclase [Aquabacterium sp. J223]